jgi:hypothetical protein
MMVSLTVLPLPIAAKCRVVDPRGTGVRARSLAGNGGGGIVSRPTLTTFLTEPPACNSRHTVRHALHPRG